MGTELRGALTELLELYRAGLAEHGRLMLLLFVGPLAAGMAWWWLRRLPAGGGASRPSLEALYRRDLPVAVVLGSLAAGALGALERASLVDDAFISFRYARHLARGHGLVWNLGERVEGYTNFLWTLLIGVLDWATPMGPMHWSLVLGLVVLGVNLVLVWRLGWQLCGRSADDTPRVHVPLAMAVLSLHTLFTAYGTTGLETGFACMWVLAGAYFLVARDDARGAGLAGTMWILAALTRPDHGLFYAVGGLVLGVTLVRPAWSARRRGRAALWRVAGRPLAAYAAPFSAYLVYLGWKWAYYGAVLPNTYYAKSASEAWWEQGLVYAAMFLAGHHVWVLLLCCALSLLVPASSSRIRRFRLFAVGSVLIYGGYVIRVGGDFMYGRFFVSLLPLLLLGVEAWVHDLTRHGLHRGRVPLEGLAVAGVLLATLPPVTLIPSRAPFHGITMEFTNYPIKSYYPLRVNHQHEKVGQFFADELVARGIEPVIATGGIGMVGYHSDLELIDVRGLTDPVVAHTDIGDRARPGHEKLPPEGYLVERGVHLVRMRARQHALHPLEQRDVVKVQLGTLRDPWQIGIYDRELMRRIRAEAPALQFVDFEEHLDGYISTLDQRDPAEVERDLQWFRVYYFDHNDDPARLRAIEAWLAHPPYRSAISYQPSSPRDQRTPPRSR